MSGPFTNVLSSDDDDAGIHMDQLGAAISAWAWMQPQQQSVATAALTFNTTPQMVRAAIAENPWTLWSGPDDDATKQMIEHDGE